jgi:hypothetical protein
MTGQFTVDLDEYLAALPTRQLSAPRRNPPALYQVSRWPLLKPFNGFSGIERRRGGQLAGWLLAAGCIALPERCEICASTGPLSLHGENYYDVTRDPALCRRCHRAVHLRPYQWNSWCKLVEASAATGMEWFALAPQYGLDLAGHLRRKCGLQVAAIERSPFLPLPDPIAVLLPGNMLAHPSL